MLFRSLNRIILPSCVTTSLFLLTACQEPRATIAVKAPVKTVSTSLCGDNYLQVFLPDTIAALSWQSRSALSRASPEHKALPQVKATPETLLGWRDSLILLGAGESHGLKITLPHQIELSWGEDFNSVSKNAREILSALSYSKDRLLLWEDRLKTLLTKTSSIPKHLAKPKILYLSRAGGSAGPQTFIDSVITAAGGENINPQSGWHTPNIETVLSYEPDIILTSFSGGNYHSRSDITNPVIRDYLANKTIIDIDGSFWPCAGPGLLDAAEQLQDAIIKWQSLHDA
ncbi:iron complex transport system substrate-binding protein [Litorimonas taeanensis]|uniref:Iron complex transport system substrate-binding protein n=1 Tax=Litorimonas taeanensis TaxID=568099 RepID=A0A420WD92_9PROT|nr:iron complex transport system substrate-binding protein [Litorimonas taeanensis]